MDVADLLLERFEERDNVSVAVARERAGYGGRGMRLVGLLVAGSAHEFGIADRERFGETGEHPG